MATGLPSLKRARGCCNPRRLGGEGAQLLQLPPASVIAKGWGGPRRLARWRMRRVSHGPLHG